MLFTEFTGPRLRRDGGGCVELRGGVRGDHGGNNRSRTHRQGQTLLTEVHLFREKFLLNDRRSKYFIRFTK